MEFSGTPQEWNEYIARQPHAQFLQSYEWGEFQKKIGRQVWYLDRENTIDPAHCLAIAYPLKGNMFYIMCPRGPIGSNDAWFELFVEWSKKQGALFSRVEPSTIPTTATSLHVRDVNPATERFLDLTKTETELLAAMHSKTRYNINLSQKKEIVVVQKKYNEISDTDIEQWWALTQQTATRNRISVHPKTYYKTLLTTFPYVTLYESRWNGTIVAMTAMVGFGDTMYYLYGASSQEHKEVMAPYLLHWQAIIDAKNSGYRYYNFGGIAPDDSPSHPLVGVTRFKKGFGGEIITYPGTFDIPNKKMHYNLYTFLRNIKRSI